MNDYGCSSEMDLTRAGESDLDNNYNLSDQTRTDRMERAAPYAGASGFCTHTAGNPTGGMAGSGHAGTVLDAVYASPSLRAFRTAEIIRGERNIPLHAAEAFMELGLGEWEGRTSEENEVTHPDQYSYFWEDPIKFKIKDSETFEEVKLRALAKLQDIVAAHRGQSVLIVTHTVVIKVLMTHLEGRPLHKLWDLPYIHPTCLNRIDFKDGSHEIVLHGDISHYESDADEV